MRNLSKFRVWFCYALTGKLHDFVSKLIVSNEIITKRDFFVCFSPPKIDSRVECEIFVAGGQIPFINMKNAQSIINTNRRLFLPLQRIKIVLLISLLLVIKASSQVIFRELNEAKLSVSI